MITNNSYCQKFNEDKICVIIPTYNNSATLKKVIDDILEFTDNIIVVNDGSTDSTTDILKQYKNLIQINYSVNVGKGWAIRQGFECAIKSGYDYAITIDSDGQHFASDLPKFIEKLEQAKNCLIIGARNMMQSSVPGKSSFGHQFSNFWFWVETGIKAPDTQSGYRLYPVSLLKGMKFLTKKYEFEIEVIVRAAWRNIKIESVPVSVYYAPKETRISHFRPFKDFLRISLLNTILVIISFIYINPRNFFQKVFKKDTYINFKEQIINSDDSKLLKSVSVAFGIFMGIIPIWGFQLIAAIALAIFLNLNKALVIICANISIPPMIPLIIYLSYKMGAIWMGNNSTNLIFNKSISLEAIRLNFIQYLYGSISLALVAALLFGGATYLILSVWDKNLLY